MLIPDPAPLPPRKAVVTSRGGIVAAQTRLAAAVGAQVLAEGGNAVDAAVATGFAANVVEPWMNGLGGCGFMVVAMAGAAPQVVDFSVLAPAGLDPADYPLTGDASTADSFNWAAVKDDRNLLGYPSIAVPGQVDGMRVALERFGSIGWAGALEPAIALAERGLPLEWPAMLQIAVSARDLRRFPATAAVYLPDGLPPVPSDEGRSFLPLGNLPRTLRRLASAGARDFYDGDIAQALLRDLRAGGNRMAEADLRNYRASVKPALDIDYRGASIAAVPGPSGGPTLADILGRLTRSLPRDGKLAQGPGAAAYAAYAQALDGAYAARLATLGHGAAAASCTTHLSVVDRHGNMVALTQTLLSYFGSKVLLPETGILMNNGVLWFDPQPGRPNSIAAGKRPLSNMSPVVVRRGGQPWLALGASGGRRIVPAVTQILSFLLDYGMTLEEAFHQPRLDVSGEGRAILDSRLPREVDDAVAVHMPVVREPLSVYPGQFACPSAVMRDPATGWSYGMSEIASPTSGGVAVDSAG